MFTVITQINLLGVLVATLSSFILGGIWFGAIVGKLYLVAMGKENAPQQKPSLLFIFGPMACNFVITLTSAMLLTMLELHTLPEALAFGALVGIGYLISMCMMIAINPNFPHPFLYTAINAPYFLGTSLLSSVILVLMG